jgi:predicted Rossmann-fold nucleotide-binding protein
VFCNGIAKYFSNALREDGLLARCDAGLVVLEGAAGTVQEVFQTATRLYYAPEDEALPVVVLVGREHWTRTVPAWQALTSLAAGRAMEGRLHLVDDVDEAAAVVLSARS